MKTAFATLLAASVLAPISAFATSYDCGNAPQDQWVSMDVAKAKGVELGYDVRAVKIEDGCYELYAIDKDGRKLEAYLHPVTTEVVKTELDD